MIPLWLIRLGIYATAALAIFSAGALTHMRWAEAKAARLALQASEQARKVDHANAVSLIRKMDSYSVTAVENQRRALVARTDLDGLRHSAAAIAAAPAASACGPDPRLARIAELLGEGASLAEEGARHVDELRAQRDALK